VCDAKQLSDAVWDGNLAAVDALIRAGADVNIADDPREPPLHLAIEQMWIEIIRRLIQAGADVNRSVPDGWTPLVHAIDSESDAAWQAYNDVGRASTEIVELLLASGAEPTASAFEAAAGYDNQKALILLRRHTDRDR
jgi:ankyrin repeat protein